MAPQGTMDASGVAMAADSAAAPREIKEWQAIMDHLRRLPAMGAGQLPVIPMDARAAEVRAIKLG
jgi:5'-nucleotidase